MRGRALGGGMAVGPLPVGVCVAAGHVVAKTKMPAAQTLEIRPVRVIAQS